MINLTTVKTQRNKEQRKIIIKFIEVQKHNDLSWEIVQKLLNIY